MINNEKIEFSKRLNHALDLNQVPKKGKGRQLILAEMLGVSQKGASKWLEGLSFPSMERLSEISSKLNVNMEWLLTGSGAINTKELPKEANDNGWRKLPILQWSDVDSILHKKISLPTDTKYIFSDLDSGPQSYALVVREDDDTMAPRYCSGDIIIVDPDAHPIHKSIIVVKWKDSGKTAFVQYLENGPHKYLSQNNKTYDSIRFSDAAPPFEYLGRARQIIMTPQ